MPLRQQRPLEVRALGLCAFERGAQLSALRPGGRMRISRVFFLGVGSPYRYSYLGKYYTVLLRGSIAVHLLPSFVCCKLKLLLLCFILLQRATYQGGALDAPCSLGAQQRAYHGLA